MTHYCKQCDKIMKRSSKFKHNKSFNHSCLQRCILRRYVMLDIDFDEVYDTVLKYIGSYCEKYEEFDLYCVFKMLTKTNNIKYVRIPARPHLHYLFLKNSLTEMIDKEKKNMLKILEMRITFISIKNFMTYNQYLKQKRSMLENKLNQILCRNPSLVNQLEGDVRHPMIWYFARNIDEENA